MKSLWDKYQELLKSKYLEVFFPERTEQEIAKMLGKKITEMSEQEIAEMCEQARIRGFRIHGSRIQESEQEMVEIWKNFPKASRNRSWDPWFLGMFFNPIFWFKDHKHFFNETHLDEFNQYMKNTFKNLAKNNYHYWGEGDQYHDETHPQYNDPQQEEFLHPLAAEERAVYKFCQFIYQDFEVINNCYIMPRRLEHEDRYDNSIVKEASLAYTNPDLDVPTRQILCRITDEFGHTHEDEHLQSQICFFDLCVYKKN